LRSNHINFRQYDVEKDRKAAARMRALGGTRGVPFAVINGKKVGGYSPDAYKQALGLP
jgi:glutaredoxin